MYVQEYMSPSFLLNVAFGIQYSTIQA